MAKPRKRPLRPITFLLWFIWALCRAGHAAWSTMATSTLPRWQGGIWHSSCFHGIWSTLARVNGWACMVVARLAKACPICFAPSWCPYHERCLTDMPNFARILRPKRERTHPCPTKKDRNRKP